MDVVAALAARSGAPDAQRAALAVVQAALDGGAELRPRGVHERLGLVQAAGALAAAPGDAPGGAAVAEAAAGLLCAQYRCAARAASCAGGGRQPEPRAHACGRAERRRTRRCAWRSWPRWAPG